MTKEQIGVNAGIVWQVLYRNDPMTSEELAKECKLNLPDTAAAIGWLAREDKILFQQEGGMTCFTVYREHYY